MKSKISKIFNLLFILIFIIGTTITIYISILFQDSKLESFSYAQETTPSYIYDKDDKVVKELNRKYKLNVTYEELPEQFIAALLCAEDLRFFSHPGIDFSRLIAAMLNNIKSGSFAQGASTLTQQLIKNTHLSNDKTIERKIKEIIMSLKLEQKMSKKEIITSYANLILFDGITPGVNNASNKFFGKNIWEVNVVEAASLAALVKSPTIYNPIRHPEKNKERRNIILKTMYEEGYISCPIYEKAILIETEALLKKEEVSFESYPYQAYIDIVYKQVEEMTGLDPYSTPMKIYTHLDKELQSQLDDIQDGVDENIKFIDEEQQLAASVIDNNTGALIAVIGGRNYKGERLLNRAYDVKRQPASTIKPILSYALAFEYLNWSDVHVVNDVPYTYPGTNKNVQNVDSRYMGEMLLEEALGYSRNTVALDTLQKVINKTSLNTVLDYMEKINFLDCEKEKFNMSYGLGGMYKGVTPTELAAAYAMFPSGGIYRNPLTIRKIVFEDGTIKYFNNEEERLLSEESAFKMCNVLKNVVNNNYWSMGTLKQKNRDIAAKTGTSNFDYNTLSQLNYPNGASKDIWYAGFSRDYTVSVWTGFDVHKKNAKTYFAKSGDSRVLIAKKVLNKILNLKAKENNYFEKPDSLYKVNVVRGVYPYVLPDEYTPSYMIVAGYFKKEEIPTQIIRPQELPLLKDVTILQFDNKVKVIFETDKIIVNEKKYGKMLYSNEMIYGKVCYNIKFSNGKILKSTDNAIEFEISLDAIGPIDCYLSYEKKEVETSHKYYNIFI